jgi:hypothetical protein
MTIRPPRAARRRHRSRFARDLVIITGVSATVVLFGLRCLMAIFGIDTWTVAWTAVDLPTGLFIGPLEQIDFLKRNAISNLTFATLLSTIAAGVVALVALGTLANERE